MAISRSEIRIFRGEHNLSQSRKYFFNSLVKIFKFQLGFALFPKEMHQQRCFCFLIHVLAEGKLNWIMAPQSFKYPLMRHSI